MKPWEIYWVDLGTGRRPAVHVQGCYYQVIAGHHQ